MVARRCRNVSKHKREQIYRLDGYQCVYCGRVDALTIDHVVPISACIRLLHRSVANKGKNLVTACTDCNNRRDTGPGSLLNHGRFAGRCIPFHCYYQTVMDALTEYNLARLTVADPAISALRTARWMKRQIRIHPKTKELIETLIPIS